MGERGVLSREFGGQRGAAGANPAIEICSNLSPNPVVVWVVGTFSDVKARGYAEGEVLGYTVQESLVGREFSGERGTGGQVLQPSSGNMFGLEFGPMSFEEDQGQECVVDVVVWLASTQPLTAGTRRDARREGTFDKGNVVAQRIGAGITQEVRQIGVTADHGKDLNRLSQLAAGDASLPSSTNPIAEFCHRNTIIETVREIPPDPAWIRVRAAGTSGHPDDGGFLARLGKLSRSAHGAPLAETDGQSNLLNEVGLLERKTGIEPATLSLGM